MTAKEEVLETIRLWIAAQKILLAEGPIDTAFNVGYDQGYGIALYDLTELLDAL